MSAIKKLPHRRWEVLRDLWLDHLPDVDFETEFPAPTIWQLPNARATFLKAPALTELPYLEGLRESAFREAMILCRKFTYCRRVAQNSIESGYTTWSIIAAYDACFYAARAFCNLLGFVSLDRHSKIFLDLFFPRILKSKSGAVSHWDTIVVHQLQEPLTHKMLWEITSRLSRTFVVPDDISEVYNEVRGLDFDSISNFRNNLIYDGGFWHNREHVQICDLTNRISEIELWNACRGTPTSEFEDHTRYFSMSRRLGAMLNQMLWNIAKLAPALQEECNALEDG